MKKLKLKIKKIVIVALKECHFREIRRRKMKMAISQMDKRCLILRSNHPRLRPMEAAMNYFNPKLKKR